MDSCRKYRDMFIEALYDDLHPDASRAFEAHLKGCPECAASFADLTSTLRMMSQRERTEPEPVFWSGYWDRLAEKMEKSDEQKQRTRTGWTHMIDSILSRSRWAMGTAAAFGLILIGIFIGRYLFSPGDDPMRGVLSDRASGESEMVSLKDRTGQYLRRSKILLLGLVNFDPQTEERPALNMQHQQEISQELVHEAALLKNELQEPAQKQLLELVSDLEVILLQIANLEAAYDLSTIEMVKLGVDRRGVLLKINIEEMKQAEQDLQTPDETNQSEKITT